jgi:hypothetical protein
MKIDFQAQYGFSVISQVLQEPGEGGIVPGASAAAPGPGEGGSWVLSLIAKIGLGEGGNLPGPNPFA